MSYGLLKGAFRPSDATCELRSYVRQRGRLVGDRARCVQHMQKALTQMNVQLDTVLSDMMGKTGQAIVRAMVAGERDATVLARLRDRRVKANPPDLSCARQAARTRRPRAPCRSATSLRISSSTMNAWAKMVLQVGSGRMSATVARRAGRSHGRGALPS